MNEEDQQKIDYWMSLKTMINNERESEFSQQLILSDHLLRFKTGSKDYKITENRIKKSQLFMRSMNDVAMSIKEKINELKGSHGDNH